MSAAEWPFVKTTSATLPSSCSAFHAFEECEGAAFSGFSRWTNVLVKARLLCLTTLLDSESLLSSIAVSGEIAQYRATMRLSRVSYNPSTKQSSSAFPQNVKQRGFVLTPSRGVQAGEKHFLLSRRSDALNETFINPIKV